MTLVFAIGLILACLALSAFFSAAETALMRLRSEDVEREIKAARGPSSLAIRELLQTPSRLLVTILLGNNIVNMLSASVASAVAVEMLGEERGVFVSAFAMTVAVFIVCEMVPKTFAAYHPRKVSSSVALPLFLLHKLFTPLHWLFDRVVDPVIRRLAGGDEAVPGTQEIAKLLGHGTIDGKDSTALAIISKVAHATSMTVPEIMIPRVEITAFPVDTSGDDLLGKMMEDRYTRVPIFETTIDNCLGLVHLKDLIQLVQNDGHNLRSILKPILIVPQRKPILQLMADMQRTFIQMALVKDEFGVTLGMVTQEDILEELVGEIRDEFDWEELQAIRKIDEHNYRALGRMRVLDFNRQTGWNIPAERGDTLAGLVFNHLGRAPKRGETVTFLDYVLAVTDVSGNRITQVEVKRREQAAA